MVGTVPKSRLRVRFPLPVFCSYKIIYILCSLACDAIRFTRYKNFINPSRLSPTEVNIYYTSDDRKKSILQCNYKTAICLSLIYTCDSFLLSPSTDKLCNKYLSGCFHTQEYQRFEGFACMVFNRPAMLVQIKQRAIQFNTLGSSYAKGMCSSLF